MNNQEWTIQRQRQHWGHDTEQTPTNKQNKTKSNTTQHGKLKRLVTRIP